ncbi:PH domain-containing protein [Mucilaginibacter myungsuensis]|uniref:PH domain-containing protein n=1 Tax=Mucilaginibacter myungsuensis TaxID=649104 RepID=A0A929PW39_9SPHI|nr:PH domain-containing protein [Mucilaginibacter myungsuensis]MBE9661759.1 PH domain-containing protein [Mucilaginibacter myungsuensis]MDN3599807.1 PH domain-containing protein [Mucilaginibacter myungsuensis]
MIEKFLKDDQDPKCVEKVYGRLVDLLTTGEEILYIATQKKPLVNILPDAVALTTKRVLFFTPANLGLSMKFIDFAWKDIKDVFTKEEIIGAIFSVQQVGGGEQGTDYLPKVQARKLYQYARERADMEREARHQRSLEEKRAESGSVSIDRPQNVAFQPVAPMSIPTPAPQPEPVVVIAPPAPAPTPPPAPEVKPDVLTEKLKKLKTLFDNGLISQEEYNAKKLELLSDF